MLHQRVHASFKSLVGDVLPRLMAASVICVLGLSGPAKSETVTVEAQGAGATRAEAISAGLVAAIEQVPGVKMQSDRQVSQAYVSVIDDKQEKASLSESFQLNIKQSSGGVIKSYDIISVGAEQGAQVARLNVTIERYAPAGLPTQDRRRIYTVMPTDLSRKAGGNAALLMDKLNAYLVQSRRFAVLDRGNLGIYEKELDILKSDQVPLSETVRIGQVIGADYVVIPKIRKFEQTERVVTIQLTGQSAMISNAVLNIDYVLVDVATRQIRWTGKVDKQQQTSLEGAFLEAVDDLGESILNSIYPLRVIQVLDGGKVVINQGGETLKVNQPLTVMQLGEQAFDPYTKEPLGQVETQVAEIVVERVDPKLSYGHVVSGKVSVSDEYILRKSRNGSIAQSKQPAAPAPKQDKMKW